jgi:hypothetical protein
LHFIKIKNRNPTYVYQELVRSFAKTLDLTGKGSREDGNERRRQITLNPFRRFVKTTISDLGYSDFSEIFQAYLTFLNIHRLERQGAGIQSKVKELEDLNQSLGNRHKLKDDAWCGFIPYIEIKNEYFHNCILCYCHSIRVVYAIIILMTFILSTNSIPKKRYCYSYTNRQ